MSGFLSALGSDAILGLEVLGGLIVFGVFMLGLMIVAAALLAMLPEKKHKVPRRVLWHDCPDEVVRLTKVPYDQDARAPFDWSAWERKFNEIR